MRRDARLGRIGLTVAVALVLAGATIFVIGEQSFLFSKTNRYYVQFPTVAGLAEDNPVQLNGVAVGKVERIILPETIGDEKLQVWITIQRRYAQRVRQDSVARIKTLGLLGDKFVEVTSGSPGSPEVPPGGEIPAAIPTDVDRLIASGEDVVENILATASSLSSILERMERGEGLLGELLVGRKDGKSVTDSLVATLESVERVTKRIESGEGTVGRLLTDAELGERLSSSFDRLAEFLDRAAAGNGVLSSLIDDPETKRRFETLLDDLTKVVGDLSTLTNELRSGEGLLPRLVHDAQYGEAVTTKLLELLDHLNSVARQLSEGDGTAARLINDPAVYQALDDILVGIDESAMLRWLIRNRQKKGIEVRYEEVRGEYETQGLRPPPLEAAESEQR